MNAILQMYLAESIHCKKEDWKFLNKCLSTNKQKPPVRPHDQQPDNHRHFAINCKLVPIIYDQAHEAITDLTGRPFSATPKEVLMLFGDTQRRVFNAIIFWILWTKHNDWTHDIHSIPTQNQTKTTILIEVKRYVRATCSAKVLQEHHKKKQNYNKNLKKYTTLGNLYFHCNLPNK